MSIDNREPNITEGELARTQEFWDDIIYNEDGSLNMLNVYAELHDYETLMGQVGLVYSHVTCGLMSLPNYYASAVIEQSDKCVDDTIRREVYEVLTALKDESAYLDDLLQEYKPEEAT